LTRITQKVILAKERLKKELLKLLKLNLNFTSDSIDIAKEYVEY